MYELFIRDFLNNLDEFTIKKFALKRDVNLTSDETRIILVYMKNYWQILLKGDPSDIFREVKEKVRPEVYNELIKIYKEAKKKIG